MPSQRDQSVNRRRFMQFLAGSPLFAGLPGAALAQVVMPKDERYPDPLLWAPFDPARLIKSPNDAMNVFDFEPVMRQNVPPAHFGYMASGVDDDATLRANREDMARFQLRPRRLVDVSKIDMSTEILGVRYHSPIVVAPDGGQKALQAAREVAGARRAKPGNPPMYPSTTP